MRSPVAFGLILGILGGVDCAAQWTQIGTALSRSIPGVTTLVIDHSTGPTLYALISANSVFRVLKSQPQFFNAATSGAVFRFRV